MVRLRVQSNTLVKIKKNKIETKVAITKAALSYCKNYKIVEFHFDHL